MNSQYLIIPGAVRKSIRTDGQQHPVILLGSKPPYKIVDGFRRIQALQTLGEDEVKAIIRADIKEEEAYKLSQIENEFRKALTSLDKAHAVVKYKAFGKSTTEIAKILSLSKRQVERYQEIASYPEQIKRAMSRNKIVPRHGLILFQHYKKNPRLKLDDWIKIIVDEKLSSEELEKRLKIQVRGKAKKPRKMIEKRGGGFRLYPMSFNPRDTNEADKENTIKSLEEALEILKK